MKKVLIIPNPYLENKETVIKKVINNLEKIETVIFDKPLINKKDYLALNKYLIDVDCIITLGGDGSLLKVAMIAAKNDIPLLGINYGNRGYLTSLKKNELKQLKRLVKDEYKTDSRMMLDVLIDNGKRYEQLALNDVIINKKEINVPIKLSVNKKDIYYGDGLIVSTLTGSSAYNYSAGGPLLKKGRQVVLTPICPVSRNNKSKIYEDDFKLHIKPVRDLRDEALVSVDGFKPIRINNKSTIIISASKYQVKLIRFN